jgi:hypothetical protein
MVCGSRLCEELRSAQTAKGSLGTGCNKGKVQGLPRGKAASSATFVAPNCEAHADEA